MRLIATTLLAVCILFSLAVAQSITSVDPDNALQGQKLWVTITGQNTHFGQGSGTSVFFWQGSATINATSINVRSALEAEAYMQIPTDAQTGYWHVSVSELDWGTVTDYNGFRIDAASDCGDFDGSGFVEVTDAVYLINYIFANGNVPQDVSFGDVNCDGSINITDAVYMIAYIFHGGPEPCADC